MGVVWTPGKERIRQPQGHYRLDDSLLGSAILAFAGQYDAAYSITDSSGSRAIYASTNRLALPSPSGMSFLSANADTYFRWLNSSGSNYLVQVPNGTGLTFCCIIDDIGGKGSNPGFWRSKAAQNGNAFLILNGSTRRPWFRVGGTDLLKPTTGPQIEYGKTHSIVARFFPGEKADVWWNGEKQHTAATAVTNSGLVGTNGILYWGSQSNFFERVTGSWAGISFFNGAITDEWAEKISTNYWSMYEPERTRTIFLPTTVSGIPVLSLPFASGITTGSAIPNVTLTF